MDEIQSVVYSMEQNELEDRLRDTVTLAVQRSRCRAIFEFDARVPDA